MKIRLNTTNEPEIEISWFIGRRHLHIMFQIMWLYLDIRHIFKNPINTLDDCIEEGIEPTLLERVIGWNWVWRGFKTNNNPIGIQVWFYFDMGDMQLIYLSLRKRLEIRILFIRIIISSKHYSHLLLWMEAMLYRLKH